MKKIFFLFAMLAMTMVSCSDDDYTIDEDYEKAEITGVVLYNKEAKVASNTVTINSELGTIDIIRKDGEDKTQLKMTATISAWATVTPGMAKGFQDLSSTQTYSVVSPGKSITKVWTISVQ